VLNDPYIIDTIVENDLHLPLYSSFIIKLPKKINSSNEKTNLTFSGSSNSSLKSKKTKNSKKEQEDFLYFSSINIKEDSFFLLFISFISLLR
jgi:hypothetical protein